MDGRLECKTSHATYSAGVVVNCAGAWAAEIAPISIPTRPVKGQMVCVVPQAAPRTHGPLIRHVVRTPEIYIIPRSDGRILLGATVEDVGFNKQVDPDTIKRLFHEAANVAPILETTQHSRSVGGIASGHARQPADFR